MPFRPKGNYLKVKEVYTNFACCHSTDMSNTCTYSYVITWRERIKELIILGGEISTCGVK